MEEIIESVPKKEVVLPKQEVEKQFVGITLETGAREIDDKVLSKYNAKFKKQIGSVRYYEGPTYKVEVEYK